MKSWKGSLEQLKELVNSTGVEGEWVENNRDWTFKAPTRAILKWYPSTGTIQYQGPKEPRTELMGLLAEASNSAEYPVAGSSTPHIGERASNKRIFVVHGHDDQTREQLELILHRLGLEPFVLANTAGSGLTIIEALEQEMGPGPGRSRFGIVLLTPDDFGYAKRDGSESAQPRARQNVILEMGMLIGKFGRQNVVILKRGHVEVPSDASGIIYLGFNDHVREIAPKLCERLRHSGFDLSAEAVARAST